MTERREYRQGRYVFLLDDNDHTVWIKHGHIGRCKTYRIPSSVNIEGVRFTVTSVELGAYKCPRTLQHLIFPDTIDYIDEDEFSKKNAAILESLGYEIYWNAKFGHRCNEQAAKQIKNLLSEANL